MFAMKSWTGTVTARAISGQLCCLLVASSIGCVGGATLQDTQYCLTQKTRAEVSWLTCNGWKQRWELGSDYAYGYKKGYYDASTGRGCKLPAVPPECYWTAKYQDCEGQAAIAAWYRGYQCGVTAAQSKGLPSFHEVPLGPSAPSINNTSCQGCYSPDNCACSQGNFQIPPTVTWQDDTGNQFHGGLFGQYGSELAMEPHEEKMESPAGEEVANSSEEKSASDDSTERHAESVTNKQ